MSQHVGDVVRGATLPQPTVWKPEVRSPNKYWAVGNHAWEDELQREVSQRRRENIWG